MSQQRWIPLVSWCILTLIDVVTGSETLLTCDMVGLTCQSQNDKMKNKIKIILNQVQKRMFRIYLKNC